MTSPGRSRRTQPVEVVDLGSARPVEAVEVGAVDPLAGAELIAVDERPPATGGTPYLDDLLDVDAPRHTEGVLARGPDGVVRPIAIGDAQTDFFRGDGPPPDVVPGAGRGDLYLDRLTGDLYRLD